MRKLLWTTMMLMLPMSGQAGVFYIKGDTVNNAEVNEAGIYFNGPVNNQTVTWLISSLAEIHGNYRNIKNVDLYINSEGGDMDSGYVAYETLRNSPVKLSIINAAMTGSAATMIYCASEERYAMPMAVFMLHPAATGYDKADYIKPDQARRIMESANNYNELFRRIYSSCTKIPKDELEKITASESGRVLYKIDEAEKKGLVTRGVKESHGYPVTYFITNNQS